METEMPTRPCEICTAISPELIYKQTFIPFDDGSTLSGYDVVICGSCGHGYADRIPSQDFYDRYYREMSKYNSFHPTNPVDATHPNYRDVVASLEPFFSNRNAKILDVGTGTGHLLGAFKNAGYRHLLGIDPSPQCAADAKTKYGVDVVATPISQMAFSGKKFDLVLLTSVIEHLGDATASLKEATALVAPGGAIFIDAPDAERFGDFVAAPFQQFSLEHINYFSAPSLSNAFARLDFRPISVWSDIRHDGPVLEPVLCGLFTRDKSETGMVQDQVTGPSLRDYVKKSCLIEKDILKNVASLIEICEPVIIWGVGTLTLRLLATDSLKGLKIAAFVDSNRNYQGKEVLGIKILPPQDLVGRSETILIATRAHQSEIYKQIRTDLRLLNPAVMLFPEEKS